jgi:hypothetical protein
VATIATSATRACGTHNHAETSVGTRCACGTTVTTIAASGTGKIGTTEFSRIASFTAITTVGAANRAVSTMTTGATAGGRQSVSTCTT